MAIFRIQKKANPYVILDKTFINDTRLSWKARGLLTYLLSLPSDWNIHIRDLVKRAPDGRDSVYSGIQELKRYGYVVHQHSRNEEGRFEGGNYCVYEQPVLPEDEPSKKSLPTGLSPSFLKEPIPHPENPEAVTPDRDFPDRVEPPLLNNNINKYPKNKIIKTTTATTKISTIPLIEKTNITSPKEPSFCASSSVAAVPVEEKVSKTAAVSSPIPRTKETKHQMNPAFIGETLTVEQERLIEKALADLASHHPHQNVSELKKQICLTLLDPKSFSLAGNDFFKKLHTIQKMIRKGQWHCSASALQQEQKRKDQTLSPLQQELREARAEQNHWQTIKTMAQEKNQTHLVSQFEQWIAASTTKVAEIKNKIAALHHRLQKEDCVSLSKSADVSDISTEASPFVPIASLSNSVSSIQRKAL